jgi:hypothetical protein
VPQADGEALDRVEVVSQHPEQQIGVLPQAHQRVAAAQPHAVGEALEGGKKLSLRLALLVPRQAAERRIEREDPIGRVR